MRIHGIMVLALLCCSASAVFARLVQRDMVKEEEITSTLRARKPEAVAIFIQATEAMDNAQYLDAITLFEKVVRLAPDFDPAIRRQGTCHVNIGEKKRGIALMERAVALNRSSDNLIALADKLRQPSFTSPATPEEQARALELAQEANRVAKGQDFSCLSTIAELAEELAQPEVFSQTVQAMARNFPDEMFTHFFLAKDAINQHQWITADNELRTALRLGLPQEMADRLNQSSDLEKKARDMRTRHAVWGGGIVAFLLLGVVVLRARRKPVADELVAEHAAPPAAEQATEADNTSRD